MWPMFEAIAPTLAYDNTVLGDGTVPRERAASVNMPKLVVDGGSSPADLRRAAKAAADALPDARYHTLESQTHEVAPEVWPLTGRRCARRGLGQQPGTQAGARVHESRGPGAHRRVAARHPAPPHAIEARPSPVAILSCPRRC